MEQAVNEETSAPGPIEDPIQDPPLFGTLLASKPKHDIASSAGTSIGAIVVHMGMIAALVWATMSVGQKVVAEEQVSLIELPPPEAEAPPPPPPPQVADVPPTQEIAKGFQTLSMPEVVPPDIPPPQVGVTIREEDFSGIGREGGKGDGSTSPDAKTVEDLALAPTFTPMTVRPELKNGPEVSRALQRVYPPLLRDAGIGGIAVLWFFIDETGTVVKTQVKASSGHKALDEAAAKVATVMKFRPAQNRDKTVPVWVEIPINFSVK